MDDKLKNELVAEAFNTIKQAMIEDEPSKPGSYAHSWHCNIAMCCYDSIRKLDVRHEDAIELGNEAASSFMRLCFDVETKG